MKGTSISLNSVKREQDKLKSNIYLKVKDNVYETFKRKSQIKEMLIT